MNTIPAKVPHESPHASGFDVGEQTTAESVANARDTAANAHKNRLVAAYKAALHARVALLRANVRHFVLEGVNGAKPPNVAQSVARLNLEMLRLLTEADQRRRVAFRRRLAPQRWRVEAALRARTCELAREEKAWRKALEIALLARVAVREEAERERVREEKREAEWEQALNKALRGRVDEREEEARLWKEALDTALPGRVDERQEEAEASGENEYVACLPTSQGLFRQGCIIPCFSGDEDDVLGFACWARMIRSEMQADPHRFHSEQRKLCFVDRHVAGQASLYLLDRAAGRGAVGAVYSHSTAEALLSCLSSRYATYEPGRG